MQPARGPAGPYLPAWERQPAIAAAGQTRRFELALPTFASLAEQMGPGPAVAQLAAQVALVAPSTLTVLIEGETGTGKELVAQALHRHSGRAAGPFIAVDCGAIPEALLESELFGHERGAFTGADRRRIGQFQAAEGGTLFLDEIGNLPPALHAKLLRILDSRELTPLGSTHRIRLDVRVVAASNTHLSSRVADGTFREDLYFRLAQYTIGLPPLRARLADLPHLVRRFLEEAAVETGQSILEAPPDAIDALHAHPWPGNVRELRNVIRSAVLHSRGLPINGDVIRLVMRSVPVAERAVLAPASPRRGRSLREVGQAAAHQAEAAVIRTTLGMVNGNKAEAARLLQTDYKTLHLKIRDYGIRAVDFKDVPSPDGRCEPAFVSTPGVGRLRLVGGVT